MSSRVAVKELEVRRQVKIWWTSAMILVVFQEPILSKAVLFHMLFCTWECAMGFFRHKSNFVLR